jgi:hypothetical protein
MHGIHTSQPPMPMAMVGLLDWTGTCQVEWGGVQVIRIIGFQSGVQFCFVFMEQCYRWD